MFNVSEDFKKAMVKLHKQQLREDAKMKERLFGRSKVNHTENKIKR